ncbi:MAG: gliding motility protein GldN, partial [Chitinophagaceae bacterium]
MKKIKYIFTWLLFLNGCFHLFAQEQQTVENEVITQSASSTINVAPSLNENAISASTMDQSLLSLMDTIPKSLRDDNAVPGSDINNKKQPLPYPAIQGNDVAWKQRVWEEIDVRQKINLPFSSDRSVDDQNTITFIDVLFEGIRKNQFKVFSDEKFTQYVTDAEIIKIVQGDADTTEVPDATDPRGLRKIKKITYNKLNPSDIKKYRLKEEWLFDKKTSRLVYRIIGLAPLKTIVNPETGIELGQQPLFWVYYPDCREFIASYS